MRDGLKNRQLNLRLTPDDWEALRWLHNHVRDITPHPIDVSLTDAIRWGLYTLRSAYADAISADDPK